MFGRFPKVFAHKIQKKRKNRKAIQLRGGSSLGGEAFADGGESANRS